MRVNMGLAGKILWLLVVAMACRCFAAAMKETESRPSANTDLTRAINAQQERAKECSSSKYAHVCPPGALMVFEQTMFGYCSPVGCYTSPGAREQQGDNEAAMRAAIIEGTAALLAQEGLDASLESYFQAMAVQFEMGEANNQSRMAKIVKKRPAKRDLQALRAIYDEAVHHGFAHGQIPKAARILAWDSSPAEAVIRDQAAMRAHGKCSGKASGCPRDSFPLFAGCQIAACVYESVGEDGSSTLANTEALEKAFPALLDVKDLKTFNKNLKAMAKQREKASTACNEALHNLLREGKPRWDGEDLSAVRFFVELALHEGYTGGAINSAQLLLDTRMAKIDARAKEASLEEIIVQVWAACRLVEQVIRNCYFQAYTWSDVREMLTSLLEISMAGGR